ncbi:MULTISPECIES: HD domain-containing phosphohydrolase [Aeromonas]|uniref:HD domain-containing phosphohydrolase n=1 Tax=Aeromonas TaxID=642 RepID=UPI001C21628A|nr:MULTISPECIES: HD domain-containing phosphohydrolase [Aeromonas]QWZ95499.1 PAS domain S-box protein [Aeromonas sp. FDAARGOS 1411]WLD21966.1 PAS domain S-box protein [Aeromonas veronii]
MNNDHAMAIVCDLALCIGREVTLDALLTKVLQRFMFHCATPVGVVLQQQREGYELLKVIGDDQLSRHSGSLLSLPAWIVEGDQCALQTTLPLPGGRPYHFAYRLRVDGGYLILLLAPQPQQHTVPVCHLFSPVLGNLARAIQLCKDSEQLARRQQAELVDMQRLNESLLKAIPIPVFYKDVEGRFLSCNPAFTQVTGISKAELQGKRVDEILPPEMADEYTQRDMEVLRSRQPQYFEHTLFDRSGHRYQVLNFKDLFYDHQGEVAGIIGALVDITHIKESEERQRTLLFQTIAALSSAIAHKDPVTAGHERRVHDLALAIGQQLQLPQEQLDGLGLAAMVHNIGLLQIPAEILTRPRELRPVEFELIKQHPDTGREILQQIDFPWPITTIVMQHHENLDGSGYPQGLQGDAISLEARIIRVADSLAAMTAHRPFRRALSLTDAFAELTRYAGVHYDEQVVDACFAVWQAGYRFTTT